MMSRLSQLDKLLNIGWRVSVNTATTNVFFPTYKLHNHNGELVAETKQFKLLEALEEFNKIKSFDEAPINIQIKDNSDSAGTLIDKYFVKDMEIKCDKVILFTSISRVYILNADFFDYPTVVVDSNSLSELVNTILVAP